MKKGLVTVLLVLLIVSITTAAFASSGSKNAQLYYRDITITVDGEEIVPKDANGNIVEPFIVDGTTYLPVRAVAQALRLSVSWDDATSTVALNQQGSESTNNGATQGTTIVDSDGIIIKYTGISTPEYPLIGKYINLMIQNNTDRKIIVQSRDESVNDVMVQTMFSPEIAAGKTAYDKIWILQPSLDAAGITSIDKVEFKIIVIDSETWDHTFESDIITVK